MPLRLGVDLGGTKIEIVALADDGRELLRRRVRTPQNSYPETVAAVVQLITDTEDELGQRGTVGIGIPGAESRVTGLVKNANSTCLIGKLLREDIESRLQRDVRVANDANCFTLSEAIDGAGKNAAVVFGVILGTGVGGGIAVNGSVVTGANSIAGEWGHNPMPGDAGIGLWPLRANDNNRPGLLSGKRGDYFGTLREPECYCGRSGCIEAFLSGPALTADHERTCHTRLTPQEISHRANLGDAACEATLHRYEFRLARALAQVINVLDPDVVVLGGGLSNIERLYTNVPKHWGEFIFSDHVATRLLRNIHGDSSGVRGAAWLWPRDQG